MTTTWEGTRVLLTGASSGIGAAMARELAAHGAIVGMCARRTELLDAVLAECRRDVAACRAWTVDLADLDAIPAFVARVEAELGGIDVVVNNAGGGMHAPALDTGWPDVEYLTRLNYLSPVRLTLAALPAMLARGSGRVQTVASMAAKMSPPGEAAYAGAKAGLSVFFEALAAEHWGSGVSFHLVYPALIDLTPGVDGDDAIARTSFGADYIPAPVLARAMRRQLEDGGLELYMPHTQGPMVARRGHDVTAAVELMAELYANGALPS